METVSIMTKRTRGGLHGMYVGEMSCLVQKRSHPWRRKLTTSCLMHSNPKITHFLHSNPSSACFLLDLRTGFLSWCKKIWRISIRANKRTPRTSEEQQSTWRGGWRDLDVRSPLVVHFDLCLDAGQTHQPLSPPFTCTQLHNRHNKEWRERCRRIQEENQTKPKKAAAVLLLICLSVDANKAGKARLLHPCPHVWKKKASSRALVIKKKIYFPLYIFRVFRCLPPPSQNGPLFWVGSTPVSVSDVTAALSPHTRGRSAVADVLVPASTAVHCSRSRS